MKKTIYLLTVVTTIFLTGCQNENSVNPRPTEEIVSTVTISGRVRAELVTTNAVLENAPDGLKIVAEISTRDLAQNPSSSITYPNKYYETTLSNGQYSINVEAGPFGSTVRLYFPDFRADVQTASTPVSTLFSGATRTDFVVKGVSSIVDFNY
ncbi:MAG: hypothetical protein KF856_06660 [Cyclobacteriaceae bacterium]|nr:hypothetical protein [Cyclobacteriaceae bacterium]